MRHFEQDRCFREVLMGTGNSHLVENVISSQYWGCGVADSGKNVMGSKLMEIRLRAQAGIGTNIKVIADELQPFVVLAGNSRLAEPRRPGVPNSEMRWVMKTELVQSLIISIPVNRLFLAEIIDIVHFEACGWGGRIQDALVFSVGINDAVALYSVGRSAHDILTDVVCQVGELIIDVLAPRFLELMM